jgi:hypothetical protein
MMRQKSGESAVVTIQTEEDLHHQMQQQLRRTKTKAWKKDYNQRYYQQKKAEMVERSQKKREILDKVRRQNYQWTVEDHAVWPSYSWKFSFR